MTPLRPEIVFITLGALGLAAAGVAYEIGVQANIARHLGTVPTGQPGWVAGAEVSLQPAGGAWLGFRKGQPRLEALRNACALVASGRLAPVDFACPAKAEQIVGLEMALQGQPTYEVWRFEPRLARAERHCYGIHPEELSVGVTQGRVEGISVDCGVLDF